MAIPEQQHIPYQLPPQQVCYDVLQEKYAKCEEKNLDYETMAKAIRQRVAKALATIEVKPEESEQAFLWALEAGFIPGGRVNSAAGTDLAQATLINCFVQPVGDSISTDNNDKVGIYSALKDAAETMRRGGGVGYDFSSIRPQGAWVKGTASYASGPLSYMQVFNQSCATVESAGSRRGAQMGVLRIDHPDILAFINAKSQAQSLNNFNLSVAVTNDFMQALQNDRPFQLVHSAEPAKHMQQQGAYQRDDGLWVYQTVNPQSIWSTIMKNTYEAAEPGVLFIDHINNENNLHYCETIEATNPCGEIPIPDYGCCCLGSLNLTAFVTEPFSQAANFDFERFELVIKEAVRMLDNVLSVSAWPLPQQQQEAENKRRIGLGFTGLGDALIELGLRYDSQHGRDYAARISRCMRDSAYRASIALAQEKGSFPLFDADAYLNSQFCQRLPEDIRTAIRQHGIRNSHLLSIAPTGTISLAFADNTSNGIEPAFSWRYTRTKRMADGSSQNYPVEDHAYRLWQALQGSHETSELPATFVSALDISATDHMHMQAAIQPYIDAAISKTVNVPEDYPFTQFVDLYSQAWQAGLKGITTYRPNSILGSVLSVDASNEKSTANLDQSDATRKLQINETPEVALACLRWPDRPHFAAGNPGMTYMVGQQGASSTANFAVFIGHTEGQRSLPFEVWINGAEQPRGLTALAKNLSMDMRSEDHAWLKQKLDSLIQTTGVPFDLTMPPAGEQIRVSGNVAALAKLVTYRCEQMGNFGPHEETKQTPLVDAMFSRKEPKSGTTGTLSWTVDVHNPSTGDDFAMFVKECLLPDGSHRPYSVWLSGSYPLDFNGLTKSLSLDMRVLDPAWIGKKLRGLKNLPEAQGDFFAKVPGQDKQAVQPSTVAYIARLLIHRYAMLGILDEEGIPLNPMGMMSSFKQHPTPVSTLTVKGKICRECGTSAVIKRDGCDFCTACGAVGSCG